MWRFNILRTIHHGYHMRRPFFTALNRPKSIVRFSSTTSSAPGSSSSSAAATTSCSSEVPMTFVNSLARFSLPVGINGTRDVLFSCRSFQTVAELIDDIREECGASATDVELRTIEGERIARRTKLVDVMQEEFAISVGDHVFRIRPPVEAKLDGPNEQVLGDLNRLVQTLHGALEDSSERAAYTEKRKENLAELYEELQPLEEIRKASADIAKARSKKIMWVGLATMAAEWGFLADLTFNRFSWDIMEPVTFFIVTGNSIGCFAYYVLTQVDANFPDVQTRFQNIILHKQLEKKGLDIDRYHSLLSAIKQLESELKPKM